MSLLSKLVVTIGLMRAAACSVADGPSCSVDSGALSSTRRVQPEQEHILLQQSFSEDRLIGGRRRPKQHPKKVVTSDCASRLDDFEHQGGAACVVVKKNRVLLVRVPYGLRPGWDLPGGKGDKGQEAGCETAEREVCEETGYQARAVAKLSSNVFLCELVAENVCTEAVDEGFLRQGWFWHSQFDDLHFRGWTWGDKQGLLKEYVPLEPTVGVDECGCRKGLEGWSSTRRYCHATSQTDVIEARHCATKRGPVDECGCRQGREGWSSSRDMCHSDSATEPSEAELCSES